MHVYVVATTEGVILGVHRREADAIQHRDDVCLGYDTYQLKMAEHCYYQEMFMED